MKTSKNENSQEKKSKNKLPTIPSSTKNQVSHNKKKVHKSSEEKSNSNPKKNTVNKGQGLNEINKIINNNNLNIINETTTSNVNTTQIINELNKSNIRRSKPSKYVIIFVFRNQDFCLSFQSDSKIKDIRNILSKITNIDEEQILMIYEDKKIDSTHDNKLITKFFDLQKLRERPIIFIKKKPIYDNSYVNSIQSLDYQVQIKNFPSNDGGVPIDEKIKNIINDFFKSNPLLVHMKENFQFNIENINTDLEECTLIIKFPSFDIAFDINRYINSLKLTNPAYKNIQSHIISKNVPKQKLKNTSNTNNNAKRILRYGKNYNCDDNDLTKRNSQILKLIRNNYLQKNKLKLKKNNSQLFVNSSGPYLSVIDKERIEEKENKKKWLVPEGFISCVGKYSGIKL